MINYGKRQFIRYVMMGLAFALVTFLLNACETHAQTWQAYEYTLNELNVFRIYGNNGVVLEDGIPIKQTKMFARGAGLPPNGLNAHGAYFDYNGQGIITGKSNNLTFGIAPNENPFENDKSYDVWFYVILARNTNKADYSNTVTPTVEWEGEPCEITNTTNKITNPGGSATGSIQQDGYQINQVYCQNVSPQGNLYGRIFVTDLQQGFMGVGSLLYYREFNGFTTVVEKQEETNNAINEVKDTITDDSEQDVSTMSGATGWLPQGTIDGLINLPISLVQGITTGLQGNCTPLTLPLPFVNEDIQLPCIKTIFDQINGVSTLLNLICTPIMAILLYNYFKNLFQWMQSQIAMEGNSNWGGV